MTKTVLRPYQESFIQDIRKGLQQHKRVIACAATGSGKSKVFISITKSVIEKGRTVLVISESLKIFDQIKAEIGTSRYIANGIKDLVVLPNFTYVAMAQTLAKRPEIIKQFQKLGDKLLVISDEAHVGTSAKLLLQLMDAFHIGFTATPAYSVAKHLPLIYAGIVVGPQPQQLCESGFLSPYYHYERKVVNLKNLKKSANGEFSEQSQEESFGKKEVFEGLLQDLLKFSYKKCMIFCASIKHCESVAENLRAFGYIVSVVHSKNKRSDFELFNFTKGNVNLCVSVGSLTKGFDEPQVDLVVLHRATTSVALYNQMCGRGSRLFEGKERFTILDYGGNCSRHNTWNYERDWSKLWSGKEKTKGSGVAPIKSCPNCGYMMHPNLMECPECKHIFAKKQQDKKETELIEVTNQYNLLRGKKISTLTAPELALYVKFTNRKPFGKRIAMSKGEEFLKQYAQSSGWNYGWWNYTVADESIEFQDIVIR